MVDLQAAVERGGDEPLLDGGARIDLDATEVEREVGLATDEVDVLAQRHELDVGDAVLAVHATDPDLLAGQDPEAINELIIAHVQKHAPHGVKVEVTSATYGPGVMAGSDDLNFAIADVDEGRDAST